jgi:D-beta-D-heptose 7-phosphate kinase / D-beta-D-heptose 1-phosphate adenosyltransferase
MRKSIEHPNPDALIKGADHSIDAIVGAEHVLSLGGKLLACERVPASSATPVVNELPGKAGGA